MSCGKSLVAASVRLLVAGALACGNYAAAAAQTTAEGQQAEAAKAGPPWTDPLGRSTPRGTVIGFLDAARSGDAALAARYLDTRGSATESLANQLFVVLDASLPGRLMRISDDRDGSGGARTSPYREVIATVASRTREVDIVVERVDRGQPGPVWLFSQSTLEAVPMLHQEVVSTRQTALVPSVLVNTRVAGVRLFDLLALLFGLPLIYLTTRRLNRLVAAVIRLVWNPAFKESEGFARTVLSVPARLILVMVAGTWLVSAMPVSLAARQLWSTAARMVALVAVTWLLMLLNAEMERNIHGKVPPSRAAAAASLLRLLRRSVDLLILVGAVIATLRQFGIDPTAAIAGLGVGGIAVALAAQKTLENVIAGASLIFDQAVRVGDVLKMGDVLGTVDHIGLRSTRIRTMDRTLVSVPNSQLANASLETLSARDKFWFRHIVGLRYETTTEQLHAVVDAATRLLAGHPLIDADSVRVRFFRLGSSSLDVELFAYLLARDWNHFLELQQQLLFDVTERVAQAGAEIAFPSQMTYVANASAGAPAGGAALTNAVVRRDSGMTESLAIPEVVRGSRP